jgi:hypothetical protein
MTTDFEKMNQDLHPLIFLLLLLFDSLLFYLGSASVAAGGDWI